MFGDFSDFKIIEKVNLFSRKSKKILNSKKIVLCVPNTLIYFFNNKLKSKHILLGAQNCHHELKYGPFTGSVNASMLKKSGAQYIILGHSENRLEGESNLLIKKKIISSLSQNLNVILCIGETHFEKKKNKTFSVIRKQLIQSLDKKFKINKIIIAYEPIWSIGSNKIPSTKDLKKTVLFIKKNLKNIFKIKRLPPILYGGSVNPKNVSFFATINEIDGFLIGGASQSSKKFIDIVKNYYKHH